MLNKTILQCNIDVLCENIYMQMCLYDSTPLQFSYATTCETRTQYNHSVYEERMRSQCGSYTSFSLVYMRTAAHGATWVLTSGKHKSFWIYRMPKTTNQHYGTHISFAHFKQIILIFFDRFHLFGKFKCMHWKLQTKAGRQRYTCVYKHSVTCNVMHIQAINASKRNDYRSYECEFRWNMKQQIFRTETYTHIWRSLTTASWIELNWKYFNTNEMLFWKI